MLGEAEAETEGVKAAEMENPRGGRKEGASR